MRRRFPRWLLLALPLLVLAGSTWSVHRRMRQAQLNRELVAALDEYDTARVYAALERGANPNARPRVHERLSWSRLLDFLLGRAPAAGPPVLATAASRHRWADVQTLVQHGANPNVWDAAGYTPLAHAAYGDRPALVGLLLSRGADPNLRGPGGHVPLLVAISRYDPLTDIRGAPLMPIPAPAGIQVPPGMHGSLVGYAPPPTETHPRSVGAAIRLLQGGADPMMRVEGGRPPNAGMIPEVRRLMLEAAAGWRRTHPSGGSRSARPIHTGPPPGPVPTGRRRSR